MTFDSDEKSIQDSRVVELFTFVRNGTTIGTYTSYSRDFVYGGTTYLAKQCKRAAIQVVGALAEDSSLKVDVAVNDPVVQGSIGIGVPPQSLTVTIARVQLNSGALEQQWTGYVNQCTVTGRTATFTVSTTADRSLAKSIPKVVISKACNHVLYDQFCTVTRVPFFGLVTSPVGRVLTLATISGNPDQFFKWGELQHNVTKERRTIIDQTGNVLTLDAALPTTAFTGPAADFNVTMFRGCDRTVGTCLTKFNNVVNFGGHPHIKSANFFFLDIRSVAGAR